ncbi:SAF domain-containing protein [Streptomyces cavernicola]|uniref:SAF domain-containing protein n=1 Tax=Streptomyces cavernicola TaxID=3043613 RepID=A0ABT6SJH5_9ACTN|nr:SAF domain-containing protein [Streptomyces sp. B-S-A6]MDI3408348.1 SAF domain-containing protein [Streptomyces sp. B-S-A6]
MKLKNSRTPAPAAAPPAQGSVVRPEIGISDPLPPRRRSRSRMAGGAVMVLCGALGVSWLLNSATDRTDVLAVARDVPSGQALTLQDLRVVALPEEAALKTIAASERKNLVGRHTSVRLTEGSLLTDGQLQDGNGLKADEELVAVEVERGRAPVDALEPADTVRVVPAQEEADRPASPSKDPVAEEVTGRVVKVGRPDTSGNTVVQIAVPKDQSSTVASQAVDGKLGLVLVAKG